MYPLILIYVFKFLSALIFINLLDVIYLQHTASNNNIKKETKSLAAFLLHPNVKVDNCSPNTNDDYVLNGSVVEKLTVIFNEQDIPNDQVISDTIIQSCLVNCKTAFKGNFY